MAQISVRLVDDQETWEAFMSAHPEANFLHSWYWGEFHERLGHIIVRRGYYDGNKLVGIMLGVVEPARRGRHIVVPAGPIIDWTDKDLIKIWVADLKSIAKEYKCLFVRVRPQILDTSEHQQLFNKLHFHSAPMHVTADLTSQLGLNKSDEELLKNMRKGTRYEINQVSKQGIKVESASDEKFLSEFCDLQLETAKRQNFVPFSRKFLSEQFRTFAAADDVLMYRASQNGKLLAMAFIIFYGSEAAYHYGASTELARKVPGAYAIQWEAIQEARRRGCERYNFWGVTEHGHTKHRFYGVSVFKRGFGGEDVAYLPARDLIVDKLRYPLTYTFETTRRKIRKL